MTKIDKITGYLTGRLMTKHNPVTGVSHNIWLKRYEYRCPHCGLACWTDNKIELCSNCRSDLKDETKLQIKKEREK